MKNNLLAVLFLLFTSITYAAPDLDKALANRNNWAHARGGYNNQGYSELSQKLIYSTS